MPGTRANTPLVCPREGLVEQQSLKEEIRFPILNPHGFFQPRTQHGKRPSGSKNEKIDTGALPTLFFGPNPRPMKVLAARNTFEKNRHGVFDPRSVWVVVGQDFRVNMVTIKEDNQAVTRVVQNRWASPRTKSIDIRCFWVRAHVINGLVKFEFTSTKDQAADALTKILTVAERIKHFGRMGMKFNKFEG